MKWAKRSDCVAVSDSSPSYKVAKFMVADQPKYRASVHGDFIGRVCDDAKDAQAICENHLQIMGADMEDAA